MNSFQNRFPIQCNQEVSRDINLPLSQRRIIFHHLPKTAGTTFRRILELLFDPREISKSEIDDELREEVQKDDGSLRLFAGHYRYDVLDDLFPQDVWLVFLRDPIDRLVSHYYNLHNPARYQPQWVERFSHYPDAEEFARKVQEQSFSEFIRSDSSRAKDIRNNFQTRRFVPESMLQAPPDEQIEVAIGNLDKFDFIGMQENFSLSLHLFAMVFDVRPFADDSDYSDNINRNLARDTYQEALSSEEREYLFELNKLDYRLLAAARNKFEKRLLDRISPLQEKEYEKSRELRSGAGLPTTIRTRVSPVSFKIADLDVRGFHRIENDPSGREFRWTGYESPAVVEIPVRIYSGGTLAYIDCYHELAPGQLSNAEFSLNGAGLRRLATLPLYPGGKRILLKANSLRARKGELATLKIWSDTHREPREDGRGRSLGLAIGEVGFTSSPYVFLRFLYDVVRRFYRKLKR